MECLEAYPRLQKPSLPSTSDVWARDRTVVLTQRDYGGSNIIIGDSGTEHDRGSHEKTSVDDYRWLDSLLETDPLPTSSGPSQQLLIEEEEVDKEPEKEGTAEELRTEVVKKTKRNQSRPQRKKGYGEDWGPYASERSKELKRARWRRWYIKKKEREAQECGKEYVPREGIRDRDQRKIKELEEKCNSLQAQCEEKESMRKEEKKWRMIEKRKRKKLEKELKEKGKQTEIGLPRLDDIFIFMTGRKGSGEEMEISPLNNDDIRGDKEEVAVPEGGIKACEDNPWCKMHTMEENGSYNEVRTSEGEAAKGIALTEALREAYPKLPSGHIVPYNEESEMGGIIKSSDPRNVDREDGGKEVHSGAKAEATEEAGIVEALEEAYDDLTSPQSEQSEKKGGLGEKTKRRKVEEELREAERGIALTGVYGKTIEPELPSGHKLPYEESELGEIIKNGMEIYYGTGIPGKPHSFWEVWHDVLREGQ
eukprot:sb/3479416/